MNKKELNKITKVLENKDFDILFIIFATILIKLIIVIS